jgi:hypothetical protein
MGIVNRRNAVLGWATWQVAKGAAKRKARPENGRVGKKAIAGALAAVGGALYFWRRSRSESDDEGE